MLTLNTQIPTLARPHIRALVKAHPAWDAFIKSKGKISAQARNSELIEFALMHPALVSQVELILQASHNVLGNGPANNVNPDDLADDTPEPAIEDDMASHMDTTSLTPSDKVWLTGPAGTGMATGPYDLAGVLSSVDQLLAPLVRSEIAKALGPVIDAANKPAVEVEVERIVEVERVIEVAPGEAPRAASPKARRDKRTTFRTMFPSKAKDLWYDTPLTLWAGVKAPDVDPFYVVNRVQLSTLMTAMERGSNCWLTGPAGTGKSTMPQYVAAITGRPFVKIGLTRQTEVDALVGGMALRNNATVWEDGVLMRAIRCPGTIVLLDELTFAPAGVQAIFQDLCSEHRSYTIPTTGEVVRCADGVVFVVADNTTGTGNTSGLYEGTNVSNVALVTRFARMIIVNYLTPEEEAEALANHCACPLAAAQHLATFVAECRRLPTLAGVVISMRQMVGFTQMVQDGYSSKEAFVATVSSRMPATERATIEAKADLAWGNAFDALIHSKPLPASPSNSPAAQAFGDKVF